MSFKPISKIKSTKPLQLLHMDVCGPLSSQSQGGHRYFLSITADYSRKGSEKEVSKYQINWKLEDISGCITTVMKEGAVAQAMYLQENEEI
ncbi:hypothetical protein AVEN_241016-1 [Araneus ventricosus]|uniref:Uncharacterized protein n=1 Tax=Araneus ventricosus TaxID=182803 RepID=A0A4Y2TFW8_ARAVE|nr:hypothetical protein AVEN_241016-1 [Araneus ventricosus]